MPLKVLKRYGSSGYRDQIRMPASEGIKGRLFNVIGDTIDGIGQLSKEGGAPIHKKNS